MRRRRSKLRRRRRFPDIEPTGPPPAARPSTQNRELRQLKPRDTIVRDSSEDRGGGGARRLLVIGPASYETYDLPVAGTVTMGRAEGNDVLIDDDQASRAHARLTIGDTLLIEDLGSVNGTRVRDRAIARGELVPVQPGEPIAIGSSVIIVHAGGRAPAPDALSPAAVLAHLPPAPEVPANDGGPDEGMRNIHRLAERVAAGIINVLLLGETGVGKEVMAQAIHRMSPRRAGPYVCLNCAALAENLLESERFGHERGAFTGATAAKPGLLETAGGGTLFLDEVGELPPSIQVKLLRVIETREVTRVGSVRPHQVDVRFIAATNRDLETAVQQGTFRADLFFRLSAVPIRIPPLRERRSEIRPLAETFLALACKELGRSEPRLTASVLDELRGRSWPGNIRELRNVIERAVLLATGDEITVDLLPEERGPRWSEPNTLRVAPRDTPPNRRSEAGTDPSVPASSDASESGGLRAGTAPTPGDVPHPVSDTRSGPASDKQRILEALAACAGNQSRAAKMLGMPRRTFVARLDRYKIARPKKPLSED
jgi:two-component system, NtrC family, response regulator AtoC